MWRSHLAVLEYRAARIAAEEDAEYKNESPFENPAMANIRYFEFNTNEVSLSRPLLVKGAKSATSLPSRCLKTKAVDNIKSFRWALLDRRKFENILEKFQKWNRKLKDLLLSLWHLQCNMLAKSRSH